jgi:hypothetical protein
MTTPSFRDVEQLSAYLDGRLSPLEETRLETRLQADPTLEALLADLRNARSILRRTPKHSLPRNFTISPRMAGIRPPVPRLVPLFSWASAVAAFLFIITLGGALVGQISSKTAAPLLASVPMTSQEYGLGGGPATDATMSALTDNALYTPTPEAFMLMAPQATPSVGTRSIAPAPALMTTKKTVNPWLFVWPGLAVLLLGSGMLIRWLTLLAFRRRLKKK